jgi:transposase
MTRSDRRLVLPEMPPLVPPEMPPAREGSLSCITRELRRPCRFRLELGFARRKIIANATASVRVREAEKAEAKPAGKDRHGIGRNLIKIWVAKSEAGGLDSDTAAADVVAEYEARIAALERLVGKLALENEFLKGVSRHVRQPKSASTSIVAGPLVSQSQKDAD